MAKILVTGAAGFIGMHVCRALLARGDSVVGLDNLSPYYDVALKQARLALLTKDAEFTFLHQDIADPASVPELAKAHPTISGIVHLAAQPGVRHSLVDPYAYVTANVMGQVVMLELARSLPALAHFVYASSSSVYGANTKLPFRESDPVERPSSLYAATKRSDELMAYTYAHLYGLPCTGLRFFTVYGPWGRPDMSPIIFARAIGSGAPLELNNGGEMWRDFTYVDDIVNGVVRALDRPAPGDSKSGSPPHRIYNLGNHVCVKLTDFIAEFEKALGRKAVLVSKPMPPGDVLKTYADITASRRDLGFEPTTPIGVGIPKFIEWYKAYYKG